MSGICGVINFDERPVTTSYLDQMLMTMKERGPDGLGVWANNNVGLGHAMLITTPEAIDEHPPIVSVREKAVVTADLRLDNREELIRALGPQLRIAERVGDHELILGAYEHWGEGCVHRLLGDFAFAIWDREKKHMFCARDTLGIKPFHYSYSNKRFLFGSDPEQLLVDPHLSRELNEGMIAEYLSDSIHDREETFYKGIFRLPAAHCMTVTPDKINKRRYWDPDSIETLSYKSEADYIEHFIEIFAQAVTARLRTPHKVGVLLSGGIDSSSVVSMVDYLKSTNPVDIPELETYSLLFPGLATDEAPNIKAFTKTMEVASNEMVFNPPSVSNSSRIIKKVRGFPDTATGMAYYPVYDAAKEHGVSVLLGGWGADDWLGTGALYYADLLNQGNLSMFYHKFSGDIQNRGLTTTLGLLMNYGLKPLAPDWMRSARKYIRKKMSTEELVAVPKWIHQDYARRTSLTTRINYSAVGQPSKRARDIQREARTRWLNSGMMAVNAELQGRALAMHGLEGRYPYNDRRIIEFGLSISSKQNWLYREQKAVIHSAVKKITPRLKSHRYSDPDGSPIYLASLAKINENDAFSNLKIAKMGWLREDVSTELLSQTFEQYRNNDYRYTGSVRALWLIFAIDAWIKSESRLH